MSPKHIVVIGAARSGTKILRDSLAVATCVGKVPYDIGYVWRIGNENCPNDAIAPEAVSERGRRFIRRFVDRYAAGTPAAVIEKTVGNTMRVPAVASVFPDAIYIHLIRDGVDVIESTRRQWTAPTELHYLIAKVRHFPLRLAPTYGLKYARSLARRSRDGERRMGSWGTRYPGIDEDLYSAGLLTVCARQWREAVVRASSDLQRLDAPVIEVRYEHLIAAPATELELVANFASLRTTPTRLAAAAGTVATGRVGTGRSSLVASDLERIDNEAGNLLAELGYDRPGPQCSDREQPEAG